MPRTAYWALAIVIGSLLLGSCRFPGSVKPTVKIGLSAPFEGLKRDLGYEALYAVRLAVRQRNEAGGVGGTHLVELVALNDFDEQDAVLLQARKMAVDPGVLGVLGGWSPETAHLATAEYEHLGLVFLTPEDPDDPRLMPAPVDPGFAADYRTLSGGVPPGQIAAWAYASANRLLDAMDTAIRAEGKPTRSGVRAALSTGF